MGFLAFLPAIGKALDIVAGQKASNKAGDIAREERRLQMDTLKNQIQWRVEDAKKAGINPLFALGAAPYSYSPSGGGGFAGTDFGGMGQDISRAVMAGATAREREQAAIQAKIEREQTNTLFGLEVEHRGLENELLRSQIGRMNSAQIGGPNPEYRDENARPGLAPGTVLDQPSSVVVGSADEPARQPGTLTDYQFTAASGGRYAIVPSSDVKQRIEDMPSEWTWFMRNGLFPDDNVFRALERQHPSRPGHEWRFDPFQGTFWQRPLEGRRRHY